MFEISQKGRMWAKDIGKILRCIGWNPSESDLEEAKKELETRGKYLFTESNNVQDIRGIRNTNRD